ncbi:Pyoverdine sidechain non-ribosomal peptide synthetase [Pseudomonas paraeruginosa]|nr:Pyoverdine sidechain non-ribosomal peptide synthetase [Pseudomonas aeruginosa]
MDMSVALRVARRFITLPLDKRKLYLAKMQEEGVTPANLPIPEVASAFERIPLSYAQERQWFLWQMDPQSAAYNIPSALRLRGELDVEALAASLGAIVERHQSLRTVFVEDEQLDGFRQQVLASVDLPVPVTLASGDDAQAQIRAFVESETQQPFDLRNGPLLRARLLRLAADDHVLTLTIHHAAADGWSMRVLVEELIALYGARRQGIEATLPDLPIQYADYAIWQRHWLEAGERERQLEYWMARLGGGQTVLELPTDRQRPALPSYRGARHELRLPQALGRQLQALAQREGATLFMLLLASFQALLHRYSGQDDIRVGVPVANRNRVETERLIGFFVNTQVLRADLDAQMPFLDLLQQTRVAALGAQAHQDLPFEQLVEALQPERSLSHSPLFQAMYNHQNLGSAGRQSLAAQLPGLNVEDLSWGAHSAQFDLTLDTYESEQGVHAEFTYATDLFEATTVERLARHWRNLLEAIVAEPRRRLGDLPLFDAEERAALLQRSRLPASEYPAGQGVHRLFEAQAGLTPDAPALLFGEERLSYAELNALANRLARRLREEGVGSDVLVGIALERGVPMVVALLAVLKAGGAYVPLDPQYPADRLQYMIDDSGLRLLLSQESVLARLPRADGLRSLLLDDLERLVQGYPAENPDLPQAPDSLCYAIYTSGSTGQPKGVMVRHRALTNFVCSIARQPGMLARDRLLSVTTFSFDIFGLELYVPLARGASVLLASREQAQDPEALLDLVERQGVTVLQATPATWRMLCDSERVDLLRGCTLLCGGEALAEDLAARMRELSASTWNLYGPTETTIWSAQFRLGEEARPFLGGPLANTALYILDSEMNPCPPGVAGELLIGGDGLARGYHRRPGLTAERFLPDPFAADGSRLYRTGDLARYRAAGVIRIPWTDRPPGEDPRIPHRARRNRDAPAGAGQRARGGGRRPAGRGRADPGGLPGARRGRAGRRRVGAPAGAAQRIEEQSAGGSPRLHGAGAHAAAGEPAADAERQDQPQGAAAAGRERGPGRPCRARRRAGAGHGGDLERGPEARAHRSGRQFLRAGRPFAAGDPGGFPGTPPPRPASAAAHPVRAQHPARLCAGRGAAGAGRPGRDRPGRQGCVAAAVVRPGAPVVHLAPGAGQRGLQHPGGAAPEGATAARRPAGGPGPAGPAP